MAENSKEGACMLPDAPELALDEYPMPDSKLTVANLEACGYLDGDLLPLSKDRALELFEQDLTVYMIKDSGASMAFGPDEIQAHSGLFAVSREEWEESREFSAAIEDRMKHQEQREAAFLKTSQDAIAIYQVKDGDELREIRFEPLSWLESKGISASTFLESPKALRASFISCPRLLKHSVRFFGISDSPIYIL